MELKTVLEINPGVIIERQSEDVFFLYMAPIRLTTSDIKKIYETTKGETEQETIRQDSRISRRKKVCVGTRIRNVRAFHSNYSRRRGRKKERKGFPPGNQCRQYRPDVPDNGWQAVL